MSQGITAHLFLENGQTLAYENLVDWDSDGHQVSFEREDGSRVISNLKYIIEIPGEPNDNGSTP